MKKLQSPTNGVVVDPDFDSNEYIEIDAEKLYMRDAGQTPLLTLEEELALAKKVKAGNKKAREHMIKANLRLVIKIAKEYDHLGVPLLDLVNEGNIGLMIAVEKYDSSFGAKVSTYASWWIKQSIRRALCNQSKTIRIPVHMVDRIAKMGKAWHRMTDTLGREPTEGELATELGTSVKAVVNMKRIMLTTISLDAPVGEDGEQCFGEMIEDPRAPGASDKVALDENKRVVYELLATLDEREQKIIKARFGFGGKKIKTLDEIGLTFGVTRERIRQIEGKALRRLRIAHSRMVTFGKMDKKED